MMLSVFIFHSVPTYFDSGLKGLQENYSSVCGVKSVGVQAV